VHNASLKSFTHHQLHLWRSLENAAATGEDSSSDTSGRPGSSTSGSSNVTCDDGADASSRASTSISSSASASDASASSSASSRQVGGKNTTVWSGNIALRSGLNKGNAETGAGAPEAAAAEARSATATLARVFFWHKSAGKWWAYRASYTLCVVSSADDSGPTVLELTVSTMQAQWRLESYQEDPPTVSTIIYHSSCPSCVLCHARTYQMFWRTHVMVTMKLRALLLSLLHLCEQVLDPIEAALSNELVAELDDARDPFALDGNSLFEVYTIFLLSAPLVYER